MKAKFKFTLITIVIVASCSFKPAVAFWNLFGDRPIHHSLQKQDKSPLEDLRNVQCGDALSRNKFGETEYMRGRRTRFELTPKLQRAMAAAFIAETPVDAMRILNPFMLIGDKKSRAAARIGLAFALLRKAAGDRQIWSQIKLLISHPQIAERTDTLYIKGTLALYERNWDSVKSAATLVLEQEPQHFNASVLISLAVLQSLAQNHRATNPSQCQSTLSRMIDALHPVMVLGACPTQMAHLDITTERYITYRNRSSASKQRLLQQLILAYVSRNDTAAMATLTKFYAVNGPKIPCEASVRALKLIPVLR